MRFLSLREGHETVLQCRIGIGQTATPQDGSKGSQRVQISANRRRCVERDFFIMFCAGVVARESTSAQIQPHERATARRNRSREAPNSEGLRRNPNRNLVDPSQLGCRQAYRLFKLTVADVARPRVSNAMSGDVLRPFRCDYLRTTLRTLTAKYSAHG